MQKRCAWVNDDPLYINYHDYEWGVPVFDDQVLFEFLILEGMQAGLSWLTILKKRENFRKGFADFDPEKVARFNDKKIMHLLDDSGIIRNRLKVNSAVSNAKTFLKVQDKHGSFSDFIWRYVDGEPMQNHWQALTQVPAKTPLSDLMSKDLKKLGFKFVGSTICYAYMQAVGMINDHTVDCFRHKQLR